MPTSFTITYVCIVDLLWRTHGSLPVNRMIASTIYDGRVQAQVGSQKMSRSSDLFPPVTRVHDGTRADAPNCDQ